MTEGRPSYRDIVRARPAVYAHLRPTPLWPSPGLSELLGADVWVKYESHLPTGAFKVRGGVYLASTLGKEERRAGLFTASTGNHGQSVAFGGQATGTPVTVAAPRAANPAKVAAMRALGAEVLLHGADFDEAREWIQGRARDEGARFIGPTDAELICGVGTYAVEVFDALPAPDALFVPVGAGSGACGCGIVAGARSPATRVIGVQAEAAPTMQRSWKEGRPVPSPMETLAEGLATRVPFEDTQRIMRDPAVGLADFVLVSDAALEEAIRLLLEHTRHVAEHAGAAALAAALARRDELAGRQVVLVLSGGNLAWPELRRIVSGS